MADGSDPPSPAAAAGRSTRDKKLRRAIGRANAAVQKHDWPGAAGEWRTIIDTFGDAAPPRVHAGLARALRRSGNLSAAAAAAEAGRARHPDAPELLVEAAEAAEAVRDWPAATVLWERVTGLTTRSQAPYVRLAALLSAAGDHRGAERVVDKGIARYGETLQLLDLKADLFFATGRFGEVQALLEKKISASTPGEARRNIARVDGSIVRRLLDIDRTFEAAKAHRASTTSRTIAVYSACIGAYDSLVPPEKLNDRFDYFVFVDDAVSDMGGLAACPTTFLHRDATRTARYVKTHPHTLLGNYDIAIWIDANVLILDDLNQAVDAFIRSGKPVAGVPHEHRTSVFDEFTACIERAKDDAGVIGRQRAHYASLGFDCDDLIETPWMMFNLRDPRVARFLDGWWAEIETHSRRDQLSVNLALQRAGIEWHPLIGKPQNIRDNPHVVSVPHGTSRKVARLAEAMGATLYDPFAGSSYARSRQRRIEAVTTAIDVVVCVHDALDDVRRCLTSIERHRRSAGLRLLLVDDGSGDETREFLSDFGRARDWVQLLRNNAAVGYSRAATQGIEASRADFVIVLNSDTIVTDGWAEKLADALFSTKGAGVVGPLSNAAGIQSIPNIKGGIQQSAVNSLPAGVTLDDMNRYCEEWTVEGILPRVSLIHGFCIGIHRAVLDAIGFFDVENFPRGYGEEDDFCLRAGAAGFGLVVATHTFVYHAKSKSFEPAERIRLVREGAASLSRLHGVDRVKNAVEAGTDNRILQRFRKNAYALYRTPWPG